MQDRTNPTRAPRELVADPADACSLPPVDLAERMAWIRREILPHARATQRLVDGVAFELEAAPGLAEKLDRLIELEAECCGGLRFERRPGPGPDRLRLEIHGVDPEGAWVGALAAADAPAGRAGIRLARAAGFGVATSLVVCCVVPVAAAAVLGASLASPLASLDAPGPIAAGAVIGAAAAWWWLGRRSAAGGRASGR